jgi:hypothetical protein
MEDVGLFYGRMVYSMAIWYIMRPLDIPMYYKYGYLIYFPPLWCVVPRKIWQPSFGSIPFSVLATLSYLKAPFMFHRFCVNCYLMQSLIKTLRRIELSPRARQIKKSNVHPQVVKPKKGPNFRSNQ